MKTMTLILATTGCALSLVAAGCSTGTKTEVAQDAAVPETAATESATPNDAPRACRYLTKEVAAKYMEGAVKEPEESNTAGTVSTCTVMSEKLDGVTLLVRRSASGVEAATVNASAIAESKTLSGVDPVMVEGLGDKAYWAGGKLNQMNVFKGRDWFILSSFITGFDKDKAAEMMEDVLANG